MLSRAIILHTGGIGDLILTSPALTRLAQTHTLDLLGYPERLALLTESGIARSATSLDAADLTSLYTGTPSPRARDYFANADQVIAFTNDPDHTLTSAIQSCSVLNVTCHAPLPPADYPHWAGQYYWDALGFQGQAPPATLNLGHDSAPAPADLLIHPGSGSPKKNWPLENFHTLAQQLQADGHTTAFTQGPAEEALPPYPCLPPCSLTQLARTLATARLYIGNDTGITHLAAAVGTSTIAIFTTTNPQTWAPQGPNVHTLSNPTPTQVHQLATTLLLA
jgi:ADP-heptose:LPS heptosyltransferase